MRIKSFLFVVLCMGVIHAGDSPDEEIKHSLQQDIGRAIAAGNVDGLLATLIRAKKLGLLDSCVNVQFDQGITPLIMAVYKGSDVMVRYLLEYGANPDIKKNLEKSALSMAIQKKRPDLVGLLLGYGKADPNLFTQEEYPLTIAIKYGTPEIVTILRSYGAFIGPAIHHEVNNPVFSIVLDLADNQEAWNEIKFYLDSGFVDSNDIAIGVNGRSRKSLSLFHTLVGNNKVNLVTLLLDDQSIVVSNEDLLQALRQARRVNNVLMIAAIEKEIKKRQGLWDSVKSMLGF